ncbi:MAG TPA: flavin reductase family protein [Nitrospirota bacterium]|nr:flavin reductase family protein [Nitrospirota bacterium]
MSFKESKPELLMENPFKLIGTDWMLITAGTPESFNTMTASWGGMGILWQKQVCFCFIRPTRFTYKFVERSQNFTLSFFENQYRKALDFCGSHSGRDTDKIKGSGLTPIKRDGLVYFAEARIVLGCKKLYFQDIRPDHFLDSQIDNLYPAKDYHRMYVGEIVSCLITGS